MSESTFLILCIVFISQSSALFNSILLVISSFILVCICCVKENMSTLLLMTLLFVGGLLILLVFVCSMSYNDVSSLSSSIMLVAMALSIMALSSELELLCQTSWFMDAGSIMSSAYNMNLSPIIASLTMLILVFAVLSVLMLDYSGMSRQV